MSQNRLVEVSLSANPSTSSSSSSSSSSGGATTGGGWRMTYLASGSELDEGVIKVLSVLQRIKLRVEEVFHYVGVKEVGTDSATVVVASDEEEAVLAVGEEKMFEVTGDEWYDLLVRLESIVDSKAEIFVKSIHSEIKEETVEEEVAEETVEEQEEVVETLPEPVIEEKNWMLYWILLAITVVIVASILIYFLTKRK